MRFAASTLYGSSLLRRSRPTLSQIKSIVCRSTEQIQHRRVLWKCIRSASVEQLVMADSMMILPLWTSGGVRHPPRKRGRSILTNISEGPPFPLLTGTLALDIDDLQSVWSIATLSISWYLLYVSLSLSLPLSLFLSLSLSLSDSVCLYLTCSLHVRRYVYITCCLSLSLCISFLFFASPSLSLCLLGLLLACPLILSVPIFFFSACMPAFCFSELPSKRSKFTVFLFSVALSSLPLFHSSARIHFHSAFHVALPLPA